MSNWVRVMVGLLAVMVYSAPLVSMNQAFAWKRQKQTGVKPSNKKSAYAARLIRSLNKASSPEAQKKLAEKLMKEHQEHVIVEQHPEGGLRFTHKETGQWAVCKHCEAINGSPNAKGLVEATEKGKPEDKEVEVAH